MSSIGATEVLVILIIAILLFALGRLPEFGGALSKGIERSMQTNTVAKAESSISNGSIIDKSPDTTTSTIDKDDDNLLDVPA
jgi:Sec-independent protein translocase protein TatA